MCIILRNAISYILSPRGDFFFSLLITHIYNYQSCATLLPDPRNASSDLPDHTVQSTPKYLSFYEYSLTSAILLRIPHPS